MYADLVAHADHRQPRKHAAFSVHGVHGIGEWRYTSWSSTYSRTSEDLERIDRDQHRPLWRVEAVDQYRLPGNASRLDEVSHSR